MTLFLILLNFILFQTIILILQDEYPAIFGKAFIAMMHSGNKLEKPSYFKFSRTVFLYILVGFIVGIIFLHPASMFISDFSGHNSHLHWDAFKMSFSPHHVSMSIFFGILGSLVGLFFYYMNMKIMLLSYQIKLLEGLLPICSYCKKIHTEKGDWMVVENYISNHSNVKFTHGMCPDCFDKQVSELNEM